MKRFLMSMIILLVAVSGAIAQPMAESDIPQRYTCWHIGYDVNADGSYVETQKWSATILKESALERRKNAGVTFSTSVAKGEIVEAYTLKKSGQRINVPKSSYQVTIEDGYEKASPLYSDETSISVVFPDLAVGDLSSFPIASPIPRGYSRSISRLPITSPGTRHTTMLSSKSQHQQP